MAPETPIPQTSQEQSIKERKQELFARRSPCSSSIGSRSRPT